MLTRNGPIWHLDMKDAFRTKHAAPEYACVFLFAAKLKILSPSFWLGANRKENMFSLGVSYVTIEGSALLRELMLCGCHVSPWRS